MSAFHRYEAACASGATSAQWSRIAAALEKEAATPSASPIRPATWLRAHAQECRVRASLAADPVRQAQRIAAVRGAGVRTANERPVGVYDPGLHAAYPRDDDYRAFRADFPDATRAEIDLFAAAHRTIYDMRVEDELVRKARARAAATDATAIPA